MPVQTTADVQPNFQQKARLSFLDQFAFDPTHQYQEEPPIFEGLLSRRDLVIWLGREKHRKSNLILQMAVCAAIGRDFLTFRFAAKQPLRVTYIDFESKTAKFQYRYNAICDGLKLSPEERELLRNNLQVIPVTEVLRQGATFPHFPINERPHTKGMIDPDVLFWESLEADYRADLFIVDPMRLFHGEDENSSLIERLFSKVRTWSREAAIVFAHHLSKPDSTDKILSAGKDYRPFDGDFRRWSNCARGSTAIKAHADVILCQERAFVKDEEIVSFAGFMKDAPDFGPMTLKETDHESFTWTVDQKAGEAQQAFETLKAHGGRFADKKDAVTILQRNTDLSRATAYRRVDKLIEVGLLRWRGSQLVISGG